MSEGFYTDRWFVRHTPALKSVMRIIFGVVWGIDGALKFQPGMSGTFVQLLQSAGQNQPSWMMPWFNFWAGYVAQDPNFFVLLIGCLELALAFSLIFGFMRKIAYTGGILLSLVIWSVPEGFGGVYGPGATDIGTGIIYAFVFLFLLIIEATYGTSKWSLDSIIEKRFGWWKKLSELKY